LRSELCSAFKHAIPKEKIDEIMQKMGFTATTRAETLDVKTMIALCELCRAELPEDQRKIL